MNVNPVGWATATLTPLLRIIRSSPNETVPVVVISEPVKPETGGLVNSDIALVAKGTGATLAQVPDGIVAGGNKRGIYATDWQKSRTINTYVASGNYSIVAGGQNNTASTTLATVGGGDSNTSSGIRSTIAGGNSNTASSQFSFIGGGQSNIASTNTHATVCGGNSNTASGTYAVVGGGTGNTASGTIANVFGGASNAASATHSTIAGGRGGIANSAYSFIGGSNNGTTRGIIGYTVFPASNVPILDSVGITQTALLLLAKETTGATATVLSSDGSAAAASNQVTLPNNSAYSFSGEVIAGVTGAGDSARWTINGAIKRGANAASTAMIGTPTVVMTHNDAGAAAWVVAVTANTTLGCITVTVTGAAATTIRWVCKINTTEMTY